MWRGGAGRGHGWAVPGFWPGSETPALGRQVNTAPYLTPVPAAGLGSCGVREQQVGWAGEGRSAFGEEKGFQHWPREAAGRMRTLVSLLLLLESPGLPSSGAWARGTSGQWETRRSGRGQSALSLPQPTGAWNTPRPTSLPTPLRGQPWELPLQANPPTLRVA